MEYKFRVVSSGQYLALAMRTKFYFIFVEIRAASPKIFDSDSHTLPQFWRFLAGLYTTHYITDLAFLMSVHLAIL